MGYTTDFEGQVTVEPPLNTAEVTYLRKFNETRRMKRSKGPYYVGAGGFAGQDHEDDILDYNQHPEGQPGLWCKWTPTDDGRAIVWDGVEKFYDSEEWMQYLIDHFLRPGAHASGVDFAEQFAAFTFNHVVNGVIDAQGERPEDRWRLVVKDNVVSRIDAVVTFPDVPDPVVEWPAV